MTKKDRVLKKATLDELAKKLRLPKGQTAYTGFQNKLVVAQVLMYGALEGTSSSALKNAIRKNFIINVVTALEIFFKEVIIEYKGVWDRKEVDKMLSENKISLLEALEFRKGSKVDAEHIIASVYSFTNLNSIKEVFSKLLGKDLWKIINNYKTELVGWNFKDVRPTWLKEVSMLYELRNKIVHEDYNKSIKSVFIFDIIRLVVVLTRIVVKATLDKRDGNEIITPN